MQTASNSLRRRLAFLVAGAAVFLAVAGSAMAAPSAPSVSLTPPTVSPTNAPSGTFEWGESQPTDVLHTIVRYEGGLVTDRGAEPAAVLGTGPGSAPAAFPASDTYYFRVRAVEIDALLNETPGPYGTVGILVDRTAPSISVGFLGTPTNGWFRSLTLAWACADSGGSGLAGSAACNADEPISSLGAGQTRSRTATDNVGNSTSLTSPPFNFDNEAPGAFSPASPTNGATVAAAPKFVWTESEDALSGTVRYELWADYGGQERLIANTTGPKAIDATFGTGVSAPPAMPHNVSIEWYVKAFDAAGNVRQSGSRVFRIDPTIPGPVTFTGGPGAHTNDTTPSFSWSGGQPSFEWAVIPAGTDTLVQQGSGLSKQVTLGTLAPGDYTFRVVQVTAAGVKSEEATYTFTLDTTPPAPPVIDTRPIKGSKDITPAFSWRGEVHATYTWRVIGAGGGVVRGNSTKDTSLTLAPLTPGPYTFQISQTDRAGNTSPVTAEPFSIMGPSGLQAGTKLSLPTTNHRRLKPRRGVTVPTRRPVLRWNAGPRGTTLYNVQLFRVIKRANGKARVAKVFSTFPRARQYRVPSKRTRPATCYVWRVWPYMGTRFTKKPLGISNFCIANKATLRKAAQRKAARQRAARAARARAAR